jgi:hypothetical protein
VQAELTASEGYGLSWKLFWVIAKVFSMVVGTKIHCFANRSWPCSREPVYEQGDTGSLQANLLLNLMISIIPQVLSYILQ